MSNVTATHFDWIVDDDGLTKGATVTTHWLRGEMMQHYLKLHRESPKTASVYEGEFMTIVETYLHEEDARVEA
mgnify:FL=1